MLVLLGSVGLLRGEEMIMKLIALKEKRDAAVEKAVTQIDVTYRRELEKLLSKAVSSGDRKNVERISAEIQLIGKSKDDSGEDSGKDGKGSGSSLERLLLRKGWGWYAGNANGDLVNHGNLTFLKDGSIETPGGLGFIQSWAMAGENLFEVIQGSGRRWLFEYDPEDKIARSIKKPGYIGDLKQLRPER